MIKRRVASFILIALGWVGSALGWFIVLKWISALGWISRSDRCHESAKFCLSTYYTRARGFSFVFASSPTQRRQEKSLGNHA